MVWNPSIHFHEVIFCLVDFDDIIKVPSVTVVITLLLSQGKYYIQGTYIMCKTCSIRKQT